MTSHVLNHRHSNFFGVKDTLLLMSVIFLMKLQLVNPKEFCSLNNLLKPLSLTETWHSSAVFILIQFVSGQS